MKRCIALTAMLLAAACQSEGTTREQSPGSSKPQAATGTASSTATASDTGTESSTATETPATGAASALEGGDWVSNCVEGQTLLANFKSGRLTRTNLVWPGDSCSGGENEAKLSVEGGYTLGVEESGILPLDFQMEKATILLTTDAAVTEAETASRCGIADWTKNESTEVPVDCDFVSGGNTEIFDIVKVSGATLSFGDQKGTSDATRPTALDTKFGYTNLEKQKSQ